MSLSGENMGSGGILEKTMDDDGNVRIIGISPEKPQSVQPVAHSVSSVWFSSPQGS